MVDIGRLSAYFEKSAVHHGHGSRKLTLKISQSTAISVARDAFLIAIINIESRHCSFQQQCGMYPPLQPHTSEEAPLFVGGDRLSRE